VLKTWSLTVGEEHRLRVFENRVLRRIFGPKRDEVTGECRKLHSGELSNLYSPPNIIRQIKSKRMKLAGHVARMGVLGGKNPKKKPFERPRRRWEDEIKMNVREIGWGVEWIHLAQDRDRWAVLNAVMNLRVLAPLSQLVRIKKATWLCVSSVIRLTTS
jgi:hypothetical protein